MRWRDGCDSSLGFSLPLAAMFVILMFVWRVRGDERLLGRMCVNFVKDVGGPKRSATNDGTAQQLDGWEKVICWNFEMIPNDGGKFRHNADSLSSCKCARWKKNASLGEGRRKRVNDVEKNYDSVSKWRATVEGSCEAEFYGTCCRLGDEKNLESAI